MNERCPKLRQDLVVAVVGQGDEAHHVVKDPITRRFFRFKPHEYFIARQLDGTTTPAEIAERFEREFGVRILAERVERFIAQLERLCLTETGLDAVDISRRQRAASVEAGQLRRWLYFRLKAFDPDRFFSAVVPRIGFIFTKGFVALTLGLLVIALGIFISSFGEYSRQVGDLFRAETLPVFLLLVFAVAILHEFAHGMACKHFGGEVHEIGFLLIYLVPAFFCNVSDAWLFKKRSRRLWVSLAGMFFEMFIWSVATIVWRVVDPDTWLSAVCAIVMTMSGLVTLFNLNPLIKLDGYYLLSDYLSIPNLRRNAFDYLGSRMKSAFTGRARKPTEVAARERRVYLVYGILAGIYSLGLLVFVVFGIAGFVVSRLHGAGVVLVCVVALFGAVATHRRWTAGVTTAVREGTRLNREPKRLATLVAAVVAVILAVVFGRWELKISSDCELRARAYATIRAEVPGTISQVLVASGDRVEAGQVVAILDATGYRAELSKTEADVARMEAELALLKRGPTAEEIRQLRQDAERAKTIADFAEREFRRVSELRAKNLASLAEYDAAEKDAEVRKKEVEHAESDLAVLAAGSRPEKVEAAAAELRRLEAARDYLDWQIGRTTLTAPVSGIVATARLSERVSEYVEEGDPVCEVVDLGTMRVEIPISERDAPDVRLGQKVKVKARALPERTFLGNVVAVSPAAAETGRSRAIVVLTEVDNPDLALKHGMTGNAKIYCGKHRIVNLWTRRLLRYIRTEFWW